MTRRRPAIAVAAAPNSSIIGGAGTGAGGPPVEPLPPLELDDELLDDEEDELPEAPLDPLLPPVDDELVLDEPLDENPPVEVQPWLDEP